MTRNGIILARTRDREPFYLRRLQTTLGTFAAAGLQGAELVGLVDHKGGLAAFWSTCPTIEQADLLAAAWESVGELPVVDHRWPSCERRRFGGRMLQKRTAQNRP